MIKSFSGLQKYADENVSEVEANVAVRMLGALLHFVENRIKEMTEWKRGKV